MQVLYPIIFLIRLALQLSLWILGFLLGLLPLRWRVVVIAGVIMGCLGYGWWWINQPSEWAAQVFALAAAKRAHAAALTRAGAPQAPPRARLVAATAADSEIAWRDD